MGASMASAQKPTASPNYKTPTITSVVNPGHKIFRNTEKDRHQINIIGSSAANSTPFTCEVENAMMAKELK